MNHTSYSFHFLQRLVTLKLCVYFNPANIYLGIYPKEVIVDDSTQGCPLGKENETTYYSTVLDQLNPMASEDSVLNVYDLEPDRVKLKFQIHHLIFG